jgi:hypothetical protein
MNHRVSLNENKHDFIKFTDTAFEMKSVWDAAAGVVASSGNLIFRVLQHTMH